MVGSFVAISLMAVALFFTLRQPTFVTDWEGANPLDDLIMFMMLGLMALVALFWALLGWVTHRMIARVQSTRVEVGKTYAASNGQITSEK